MKIDFTATINDLDGNPSVENGKNVTLESLAVTALLTPLTDPNGQPERIPPEEANKYGLLAQAIHMTPEVIDLTAEQVSLLKNRIGRCYSPLAVMRAWELLDPKAETS